MKLYKFMCAKEVRALHKVVNETLKEAEQLKFNSTSSEQFWYQQGRINELKELAAILDDYVIEEV